MQMTMIIADDLRQVILEEYFLDYPRQCGSQAIRI